MHRRDTSILKSHTSPR